MPLIHTVAVVASITILSLGETANPRRTDVGAVRSSSNRIGLEDLLNKSMVDVFGIPVNACRSYHVPSEIISIIQFPFYG